MPDRLNPRLAAATGQTRPLGTPPIAPRGVAQAGMGIRPVEFESENILRTPRMVLRRLRPGDQAEYQKMLDVSEAALARWVRLRKPDESNDELFQRQLDLCEAGLTRGISFRCVAVLDNGRLAGCFNINSISRGLVFEADFSWWVSSEFVSQGLATEAGEAMLEHCFADLPAGLGLHRVQAAIHPANLPSKRVAEKLGFTRSEGASVQVRIGDSWENHQLYAKSITA